MSRRPRVAVIGGGAAGFFAAINLAEALKSKSKSKLPGASAPEIHIYEANRRPLNKVRISGGGRCNVTHACFDPRELVEHYPRGSRVLRGVFARFAPRDTLEWFAARGVQTKTEADGRIFPISDDSATIVNCLMDGARAAGVQLYRQTSVRKLTPAVNGDPDADQREGASRWKLEIDASAGANAEAPSGEQLYDRVIFAAGAGPQVFELLAALGQPLIDPVPSIFTFQIRDDRIRELPGLAVERASVRLPAFKQLSKLSIPGPVLITHWGLSGPAVLRMSAFAARELCAANYSTELLVNWCGDAGETTVREALQAHRRAHGARQVRGDRLFALPARLWRSLCAAAGLSDEGWAQMNGGQLHALTQELCRGQYRISGKGVFKEEFVTAGGVDCRRVDFRTMESREFPGLFFAGEVLDVDGVTGGFNFQNAWSTGWVAAQAIAEELKEFEDTGS